MDIVIVDDHSIMVEALKNLLLSSDKTIRNVDTYTTASEYLNDKNRNIPDIIITDLMMPKINGLLFTEKCKELFGGKVKIIILSFVNDSQSIRKVIRAGANAFVSKADKFSELEVAIEKVMKGETFISKSLKELMIENMFTQEQVVFQLSRRESEVLKYVCNGNTIKETAFEMNLSPNTVQYYHKCILDKFKLKKRSDMIVFAIKHGLFVPKLN